MSTSLLRICGWLIATLLLIAPALWNGFPLLQYDTGGYLARWYEGYLVPSRAVTYGLFLSANSALNFWPVVLLQAAAAVWIIDRTLYWHGIARRALVLPAVVGILAALTALPWIASVLLTDVFAGVAVLGLHLLAFKSATMRSGERLALILVAGFAASTHGATFLLVCALAIAFVAAAAIRRTTVRSLAPAIAAPIVAAAMLIGANFVLVKRIAWTPGGYGIVFGRMLEDGLVKRYLDEHCSDPKLRLCPHRATMPQTADEFLWGESVFNELGRFDGLADEMRSIVLGSLAAYPSAQLVAALRAGWRQLFHVQTGEGFLNTIWHTYGMIHMYTPTAVPALRAARQQRHGLSFRTLNRIHVPAALFAMALLPLLCVAGWRKRELTDAGMLAATAAIALLGNAFICGVISNPHDRYGSRLVWIAPLVLLIAALQHFAVPLGQRGGHTSNADRLKAASP